MPFADWTLPQVARLPYTYAHFARAKVFVYGKWCDHAADRHWPPPADLSGACKYGSLFIQAVFGGAIRGHFEHQYNVIDGRLVDLGHDAADVGRMHHPYLHEPDYFRVPEVQQSLSRCEPRARAWADEFLALQG